MLRLRCYQKPVMTLLMSIFGVIEWTLRLLLLDIKVKVARTNCLLVIISHILAAIDRTGRGITTAKTALPLYSMTSMLICPTMKIFPEAMELSIAQPLFGIAIKTVIILQRRQMRSRGTTIIFLKQNPMFPLLMVGNFIIFRFMIQDRGMRGLPVATGSVIQEQLRGTPLELRYFHHFRMNELVTVTGLAIQVLLVIQSTSLRGTRKELVNNRPEVSKEGRNYG
mmetsp:Transcript_23347/g.33494  ORF Transcript_23347/g.33494 Transcript_23347/m.33494 type:complete len:224 (-) Transcript_23347:121-792(-)